MSLVCAVPVGITVALVAGAAVIVWMLLARQAGAAAPRPEEPGGPAGPVVSVPTGQISRNFSYAEFFRNEAQAPLASIKNVQQLVAEILQPARDAFGKPIIINSGFRSMERNEETANAATKSAHLFGAAADVTTPNPSDLFELHNHLFRRPFGELILYRAQTAPAGTTVWAPRWIHVSLGGYPTYNKVLMGWIDKSGRLTFSRGGPVGTGEQP